MMGKIKTKSSSKIDRNVEISAPILDPQVIRAIHSPPGRNHHIDPRQSGFKVLLSDMHQQDSTDELVPSFEINHIPSYIGISCAVSGYINPLHNRALDDTTSRRSDSNLSKLTPTPNRSRTNSPIKWEPAQPLISHFKLDKRNLRSVEEERRELTGILLESLTEKPTRIPSPIPPIENDRHHGAYVGARYFPMPEPSRPEKHIPLLGIDDHLDPDQAKAETDEDKVEKKIASLYGDDFVEGWKESMSKKTIKEREDENKASKESVRL